MAEVNGSTAGNIAATHGSGDIIGGIISSPSPSCANFANCSASAIVSARSSSICASHSSGENPLLSDKSVHLALSNDSIASSLHSDGYIGFSGPSDTLGKNLSSIRSPIVAPIWAAPSAVSKPGQLPNVSGYRDAAISVISFRVSGVASPFNHSVSCDGYRTKDKSDINVVATA